MEKNSFQIIYDRLKIKLLGYDVFISYRRSDAHGYAKALQEKLSEKLVCFLDEGEIINGDNLPNSIQKGLNGSKMMILIASPNAATPPPETKTDWIEQEVLNFRGKNLHIIDINNSKEKFKIREKLKDLVHTDETVEALVSSKPSKIVIERIYSSIKSKTVRTRSNQLSYVISAIFLIVMTIGGYFYRKSLEYNKTSIANDLIAEGNKHRKTEISKALLMYAYAYETNPSLKVFNIVNDYYQSIIDDSYTNEKGVLSNYSQNKFYQNVLINDTLNYHNEDDSGLFVHLIPSLGKYFSNKDSIINFYDLKTNHLLEKIKIKSLSEIKAEKTFVLFTTDNNLYLYNISSKKKILLVDKGKLNDSNEDILSHYQGNTFIQAFIKNSKIFIFKQFEVDSAIVYFSDIKKISWEKYQFRNTGFPEAGHTFLLLNTNFEKNENEIHYRDILFYGNQRNYESIINLKTSERYYQDSSFNSPNKHSIVSLISENYLITGSEKGDIEVHSKERFANPDDDTGETFLDNPKAEEISNNLVDFVVYKDFLIAGYSTGKLNFYLLKGRIDNKINYFLQRKIPLLKSINLPNATELDKLILYKDDLYVTTHWGNIFLIPLNVSKLKLDKNNLLSQLKSKLGLQDLSKKEKERFRIN